MFHENPRPSVTRDKCAAGKVPTRATMMILMLPSRAAKRSCGRRERRSPARASPPAGAPFLKGAVCARRNAAHCNAGRPYAHGLRRPRRKERQIFCLRSGLAAYGRACGALHARPRPRATPAVSSEIPRRQERGAPRCARSRSPPPLCFTQLPPVAGQLPDSCRLCFTQLPSFS